MKDKQMKENYNIKVDMRIYKFLKSDVDIFNQKNKSRLINKIIAAYVTMKNEDDVYEKVYTGLLGTLPNSIVKENEKSIKRIIKRSVYETLGSQKRENGKMLNFRLNKETYDECSRLGERSDYFDTDFFRGVFEWYVSKPKFKREQIIFREEYNEIKVAIEKELELKLEVKNGLDGKIDVDPCYPLGLFSSKDENYNYLISADRNEKVYVTRISNILKLIKKRVTFEVSDEVMEKAKEKKEKKNSSNEDQKLIKIEFTEYGYYKFKNILHQRPEVIGKYEEKETEDGKVYILEFIESEFTIRNYLVQFGKEFRVIEPITLRGKIQKFYQEALEHHMQNS